MQENLIQENLENIYNLKANGASDKQIYEQLKISHTTWNKYKKENKELQDVLSRAGSCLCVDLKSSLKKLAEKHTLTTEKKVYKVNDNGEEVLSSREVTVKEIDASPNAIIALLANYDDEFDARKKMLDLKKLEIENKIEDF